MSEAHKTPCDDPSCPQFVCENRNSGLAQLRQTDSTRWESNRNLRSLPVSGLVRRLASAENRIEELEKAIIKLCDGMDHDDEDCPEDDTCECANVAEINALFSPAPSEPKTTENPK